jgi:hypothetical protein
VGLCAACSSNASTATGDAGVTSGGSSAANAGGQSGSRSGGATSSGGAISSGGSAGTPSSSSGDITCRAAGDGKTTLTFVNQCTGTLSVEGSNIAPAALAPGEHACRDLGTDVEAISSVRFWGYLGEDPGAERHTLAEFTFNTDFYDFDWYDISHVDAFNLPMAIVPVAVPNCRTLSCPDDLLAGCPDVGQYRGTDGSVIACVSPERDNPDSVVVQYFDTGCADAYAWSGDDAASMAACAGEDYDVVFCP